MSDEKLHWISASRTHVGHVRKLNEDACLELPEHGLWVVADGMGGHTAGDVASRMIVDSLHRGSVAKSLESLSSQVQRALQKVNRKLNQEAYRRGQQIIGSTVAVLLIHGQRCICLWAGDSRIFLLRDSRLRQLTTDHSQIEELIAQGRIAREQAESLPGSNAITRAVGVMKELVLDSVSHDVCEGDRFLLCSDGLYNEVKPADMAQLLALHDCRESADRLVEKALQGKARDNITAIVVSVEDDQATKTLFNPSAVRTSDVDEDDDKTTVNR